MQNDAQMIKANALINKKDAMFEIKQLAKEIARQNGGVDDITLYLKEAYDRISNAPTIDAVPVVHARNVTPTHYSDAFVCVGIVVFVVRSPS